MHSSVATAAFVSRCARCSGRVSESAVGGVSLADYMSLCSQELLTSLFIATYNHQDADGRCFSDSLAELPEHDEVEGQR